MESSNWQTQLSTFRKRTLYAFKNSLFCDVEFTVTDSVNGEKVTVPANKYMLAVSSPVFEAMFYGNLKEKKDIIDLEDCTKEGLQELLRFAHCDEVHLTGNNVMEVLYIADKYIMPFLVMKCREYLQEHLKPEEVFTVLPQVQKLNKELEEHCWKVIDNKTKRAVSSEPFLEISREILCEVLTRDSLKIKELKIFNAVDKWAAKRIEEEGLECSGASKRAVLGEDIIRLIRFPLMSHKDLAKVVLPCEILEKQELTELFQMLIQLSPPTSIFEKKWRASELTTNRFRRICPPEDDSEVWRYEEDDPENAIDFSVNKAVSITGVQLFGRQGATYDVILGLSEDVDDTLSICERSCVSELVDDLYYGFTVKFDKPINLAPNIVYTIGAQIKGPVSYYGVGGQEVVQYEDLKITYKSSKLQDKFSYTTVSVGQFPSFLLIY